MALVERCLRLSREAREAEQCRLTAIAEAQRLEQAERRRVEEEAERVEEEQRQWAATTAAVEKETDGDSGVRGDSDLEEPEDPKASVRPQPVHVRHPRRL